MTTEPTLTPAAFAAKWRGVDDDREGLRPVRTSSTCAGCSASRRPTRPIPTGATYAFEKRVDKAGGGDGLRRRLEARLLRLGVQGQAQGPKAAYVQLLGYKDDLGNPPLLIVSDLERIEIRTNFTGL